MIEITKPNALPDKINKEFDMKTNKSVVSLYKTNMEIKCQS